MKSIVWFEKSKSLGHKIGDGRQPFFGKKRPSLTRVSHFCAKRFNTN